MRKRLIPSTSQPWPLGQYWLGLETLASVEVTSEDTNHPIESALLPSDAPGWRATKPGEQTITLWFDDRSGTENPSGIDRSLVIESKTDSSVANKDRRRRPRRRAEIRNYLLV
jgi:hypothetical protein